MLYNSLGLLRLRYRSYPKIFLHEHKIIVITFNVHNVTNPQRANEAKIIGNDDLMHGCSMHSILHADEPKINHYYNY